MTRFLLIFLSLTAFARGQLPLATVTFVPEPDQFQLGRNFIARCEVQVEPKMNDWRYRVTYYLNGVELGEFTVNGLSVVPTWSTLNLLPGVNIYPEGGRSQYPFFYTMIQPLNSGAAGTYQCAVKSDYIPTYPTSRSIYFSNKWNASRTFPAYIPTATVKYSATPYSEGQSALGTYSFTGQCVVSLSPSSLNYNVTFRMGRFPLGEFAVTQDQYPITTPTTTYRTVNILPGINLFPRYESAAYPNFQVLIQVHSADSLRTLGNMQCSLSMELPKGGQATYFSDSWNVANPGCCSGAGGGGSDRIASFVIAVVFIVAASIFF